MKTIFVSFSVCLAFILGTSVGKAVKKGRLDMITQALFQAMKSHNEAILAKMGVYLPQVTIGRCVSPIGSGILCFNDSLEHLERIGKLAASRHIVKSEQTKEKT